MKVIFMKPEKAALNIALAPTYSYKKEKMINENTIRINIK